LISPARWPTRSITSAVGRWTRAALASSSEARDEGVVGECAARAEHGGRGDADGDPRAPERELVARVEEGVPAEGLPVPMEHGAARGTCTEGFAVPAQVERRLRQPGVVDGEIAPGAAAGRELRARKEVDHLARHAA